MDDQTVERIRQRAYELSRAREQSGRAGDAESDWFEAEREILTGNQSGRAERNSAQPRQGKPNERQRARL
jgi:hypothetical protein